MELHERLRAVRKRFKLSQTEFGKRLDVSRSVVNNWERGVVVPPGTTYKAISSVYSVNEEWLRTGEGDMLPQDAQSIIRTLKRECGASDTDAKIIEAYLRLPDEYREAIKRLAINLADNLSPDDGKVDK